MYEIAKYECVYVTEKIFNSISDVNTPQGILAIIGRKITEEEIDYSQDIIVALDDIQDPGNLGTILRTVDSIGLNQILVSKGTADSYNPKVVRSTMGAIFRVKIIECEDLERTLNLLDEDLRVVTVLYYYNDLSISEISNILSIPKGTVKSRVFRAREKLYEVLSNEEVNANE